jgi:CheY-like chemotaxis protein
MFEPYDEAQAEQAGAEAHLKKPFDSQELLDLVGRLWTEWQAGEDAGTGGAAATGLATAQVPAMETADAADGPRVASFDGDATSAFESSDLSLSVTRDLSPSQGAAAEDAAAPVWGNLDIDAAAEADSGGDSSDDDGTAGIDPEQPFGAMAASSAGASAADGDDEPFGSVASFGAAAPAADDDDEHEEPVASMAADDAGDDSDHEDSQAVAVADAQEADAEEAGGQEAGAQEASAQEASAGVGSLSEEEVDRIARRVVELLGDRPVREVAWEVVPDLAEVVIKERIRELEAQVEN